MLEYTACSVYTRLSYMPYRSTTLLQPPSPPPNALPNEEIEQGDEEGFHVVTGCLFDINEYHSEHRSNMDRLAEITFIES